MSEKQGPGKKQPGQPDNKPETVDTLVRDAVFGTNEVAKRSREEILKLALASNVFPASIQPLYEARGKGLYSGLSVPAINIRGLTYEMARTIFRAAKENKVGAFIFEIARSEIGYTLQKPEEYSVWILAAAVREGFRGPVFLQGDHFQINRNKYAANPEAELVGTRELIREAVNAGFRNIDIDASTLVELDKPSLEEQQEKNCRVTEAMTTFIRSIEPKGMTISVGGEIGEVGKKNSTIEDLRAFMTGYLKRLEPGAKGISKISVQTGTRHGGVVLADGSIATVQIDFETLGKLSSLAREEYGMCGAVQHGASTLPDTAFDMFPKVGCAEVHLATGFQNILFDSPFFPKKLLEQMYTRLRDKYSNEREAGDTDEQFYYKTRKRAFGDFKKEIWDLPEDSLKKIEQTLFDHLVLLFRKLNVIDTEELVKKFVPGQPPSGR